MSFLDMLRNIHRLRWVRGAGLMFVWSQGYGTSRAVPRRNPSASAAELRARNEFDQRLIEARDSTRKDDS